MMRRRPPWEWGMLMAIPEAIAELGRRHPMAAAIAGGYAFGLVFGTLLGWLILL